MELKITDLSKKFGDFTAVDNLNVTMTMGVYGLLGVNGAGKTTLMRKMCIRDRACRSHLRCLCMAPIRRSERN